MLSESKLLLFILFAMASSLVQPAFAVDETNETLMPKGMWKDLATGLIWDRCSIGQTWNGTTCTGEAKKYNWNDAIQVVQQQKTGGYSDWVLPSTTQLASIIRCSRGFDLSQNGNSYAADYPEVLDGYSYNVPGHCNSGSNEPTIDQEIFPNTYLDSKPYSGSYYWSRNNRRGTVTGGVGFKFGSPYPNIDPTHLLTVRVVRVNGFLGELSLVKLLNAPYIARNALVEQTKKQKEQQAKRESEAYDRRAAAFRKSVQEGDDTSQGVVVQVKGNLVKVQTNDSQCSQRDYKGNCANYINTPVEKWFKRSEIYPL